MSGIARPGRRIGNFFDSVKRNFFGPAKKKIAGVRHVTDVVDICVLAFRLRAGRGVSLISAAAISLPESRTRAPVSEKSKPYPTCLVHTNGDQS
jgi:hypothetical protein